MNNAVRELIELLNKNEFIDRVTIEGDNSLVLDFVHEKRSIHNRTVRGRSILKVSLEQSCVFITTIYQIDEAFTDESIFKISKKLESLEQYSCGHQAISSSPPELILNFQAPLANGVVDSDAINGMLSECNSAFIYVEDSLWIE